MFLQRFTLSFAMFFILFWIHFWDGMRCKMGWERSGEVEIGPKWSARLSEGDIFLAKNNWKNMENSSFHNCSGIFVEGDIYLRSIVWRGEHVLISGTFILSKYRFGEQPFVYLPETIPLRATPVKRNPCIGCI